MRRWIFFSGIPKKIQAAQCSPFRMLLLELKEFFQMYYRQESVCAVYDILESLSKGLGLELMNVVVEVLPTRHWSPLHARLEDV